MIEYEYIFNIEKDNSHNIKSKQMSIDKFTNPFASISSTPSTNIFGVNPDIKKNNSIGNSDNKNFLSIMNFLEYESESITSLLTTKEQISDTIKIIRDYCNNDIKCRSELYKNELIECKKIINDEIMESFYDSRNYSISLMLNTLLGEYDEWKQPPIMIYKVDSNEIVEGHIFILL